MKAVILAGGYGTRISEETRLKPKSLIEIGGMPILWHIMKIYSNYSIHDFIICAGYKSDILKNYFDDNFEHEPIANDDLSVLGSYSSKSENFRITLVDTGLDTMTGGRLKRIEKFVGDDTFCFTYGDTLNNANITNLVNFHKDHNASCTITACNPTDKYGILQLNNDLVVDFIEKPVKSDVWVNGGFFVAEPEIFQYLKNDQSIWESEPLKKLIFSGKVVAFRHTGFYQPMDTMKDKLVLEKLWKTGNTPWLI